MKGIIFLLLINFPAFLYATDGGGVDVGNSIHKIEVEGIMENYFPTEIHLLDALEYRMHTEGFERLDNINSLKSLFECGGPTLLKDFELQEYYPFNDLWGLVQKTYKGKIKFIINNCKFEAKNPAGTIKVEL